jgi:hypothetical protein
LTRWLRRSHGGDALPHRLAGRRYSELSEPEKLARLWQLLPGYVAAVARREGVTPRRVLEVLHERAIDDETWYAELAAIDAGVREEFADRPGTLDDNEEAT